MREHTHKFWIAAVLLLLVPHFAHAVGLGRLNVLSAIGQPFSAEIELTNVQKEEVASLAVRLASPEVYQKANLQFNSALQGLRLFIEKRPNGSLFIRAASTRVVSEPFLDLLIELQWGGGRIMREYSALLDPPAVERPAPVAAAPAPAATPITKPAPAPREPATAPAPALTAAAGSGYTVKPGDTMGRIAASVKPEGVSLEQALVGIFRSNPDAFINNNVNLVRSGKILRVPEKSQMAAIPQPEAARELRVQTDNWNSYRQKVADAAPQVADSKPATSGKITARVDDKAAADGAKDVVRLSKGDATAPKGKDARPAAERVRALEEELVAREKALAEANDRVKALEKTLNDMQKLVELKGGAPIAPKPDAKSEAAPAPKAEPPKPEPAKAADKPVEKAVDKAPESKADKAPAAPKPAVKGPPPPPKPEPGIMDTVMDNIVPIGAGGAVLAGLGAFWALRRRRQSGEVEDQDPASVVSAAKQEPSVTAAATGAAVAAVATAATTTADAAPASVASESVDPMDEAQVYLDHGRDAQAEDILKQAMQKDPQREDLQLKLLEIYAARGDKNAFDALAVGYNALTGGQGDKWTHAAAMGYALDPDNAFYAAGKDVAVDVSSGASAEGANLDFDLGGDAGTTTDIELDVEAPAGDLEKTQVLGGDQTLAAGTADDSATTAMLNLELPDETKDAAAAPATAKTTAEEAPLDFNIELPSLATPPASQPAAVPVADDGAGMDFKVDFGDLDLKLDDKAAPAAPAGAAKDPHWEDVQQKFDLARAYQEMGDKEGAREILQEVMREGSEQQKVEAEKLIASLG